MVRTSAVVCFVLLMCFQGTMGQANTGTSLPTLPNRIRLFTEEQWLYGDTTFATVDSALGSWHQVDPVDSSLGQNLGTRGSPSRPLIFSYSVSPLPRLGLTLFDAYRFQPGEAQYWRTNKRFTEIRYQLGTYREQGIEATHSQNITRNWNAGLKFRRSNVQDFLPRSNSYMDFFRFHTDYASPSRRYRLFAQATWNTFRFQSNGGLAADTQFTEVITRNIDVKGLPVNLSAAGINYREKSFHLGQYIRLLGTPDSVNAKVDLGIHETLTNGSFAYYDAPADASYYTFTDTPNGTDDSLRYSDWRQGLSLTYRNRSASRWQTLYSLRAEYQTFRYWLTVNTTHQYNLSLVALARWSHPHWIFEAEALQVPTGDQEGRYDYRGSARWNHTQFSATVRASQTSGTPGSFFQQYSGNHQTWQNNFPAIRLQKLSGQFIVKSTRSSLTVEQYSIDQYLYFNSEALPVSSTRDLTVRVLRLDQSFRWRNWGSDNTVYFQDVSDTNVLHLPVWASRHSLFHEKQFRNNQYALRIGLEASYRAGYRGDLFMPSTGSFYLQDSLTCGNVVRLDAVLDFRIKTASVFFKAENVGYELVTPNYYLTPHYPAPLRVFRFGVRWQFFD